MTERHAFLPWRTDPERCQTCDRPAAVHDGKALRPLGRVARITRCRDCGARAVLNPCGNCDGCCVHWDYWGGECPAPMTMALPNEPYRTWNDRRGQAQLPAIVAAILIAAGLVLSLHVGVVATTHQLLAWGW